MYNDLKNRFKGYFILGLIILALITLMMLFGKAI